MHQLHAHFSTLANLIKILTSLSYLLIKLIITSLTNSLPANILRFIKIWCQYFPIIPLSVTTICSINHFTQIYSSCFFETIFIVQLDKSGSTFATILERYWIKIPILFIPKIFLDQIILKNNSILKRLLLFTHLLNKLSDFFHFTNIL